MRNISSYRNVQVHIKVRTKTVLGTITGSKDLDGSWAKRSTIPEGTPVVTTKPLAEPVTVGAAPAPPTRPEPPIAVTPDPPAKPVGPVTPAPKPPVKPKPAGGADDERKAERLLKMARNYIAANLNTLATSKLKQCADLYPNTEAGKQAAALLRNFQ